MKVRQLSYRQNYNHWRFNLTEFPSLGVEKGYARGGETKFMHLSVLLNEAIEGLAIKPDGIYIDATFGRGGHSKAILQRLNHQGRLIAIDKDPEAVRFAHENLGQDQRFIILHAGFEELAEVAAFQGVFGNVNGILLDLGISSPQIDEAGRGFSFLQEGPLDMRMNTAQGITAAEWINTAKESVIADVFYQFGEERFSRRMAKAIVEHRKVEPISTTLQLAEIVKAANPRWEKHKHPATRAFQAIRIFINNELNALNSCLEQMLDVLAIGGRLAVISFHSLEDRMVKQFIRKHSREEQLPLGLPVVKQTKQTRLYSLGKAIKPSTSEVDANPRSRSAILRLAEKLA